MADAGKLTQLRQELEQARALLPDPATLDPATDRRSPPPKDLATALKSCQRLLKGRPALDRPAIRTIHHMACTGGTLLSQCIAAMPNTQLLSEIDPTSRAAPQIMFGPTDLTRLLRNASRPSGSALEIKVFLAGLKVIYEDNTRAGSSLILREHSHDHFHSGDLEPSRSTLHEILKDHYPLHSLVTVRHPLDSYLGLLKNHWLNFPDASFTEYCRRYLLFLDRHAGLDILRYEDFVTDPETHMQWICDHFELRFEPEFTHLFGAIHLSGGSGRRGNEISLRPRRPLPDGLSGELEDNEPYARLCTRLDYSADAG
ncbi:hypothetical protein RXV86_21795 [Alisedimentitalea sp. MJ-SS2]|uniref:hypothetical protein n=1 Tax=Aliisedimentitalea sp. MJ-SS2 TaxID=3049795 RepID=UPI002907B891|nr:hypothetical protein [Alisedimentitalea sp. MJ-SS2]MDU8930028.1 hypothetical protein [Alisedimentitalea sp. MJ-SS2]